ncbi:MarR family winged helix-turn-helix transcriptional regulator [Rugosimonospora africana]|uniref:MarR family winged helix-turn-helix transcriptional regulator n=1 Tax=Rugosimonospora africana TaxID=556532 RepID=UPI001942E407|nr:MarR family transcriptional regulator [Rugosimonospora africana]
MTERMAVMSKRIAPAALAAMLGDAISRLGRRQRQARPVGELTQNQISVLTSLELGGALTPRELADAERVQPPTMTKVLARLEELGLLQRTPHPTDRRQVLLSATSAGHDIVVEQRRAKDEWLTRVLTRLTPAERQILCQAAEIMSRIAREGD